MFLSRWKTGFKGQMACGTYTVSGAPTGTRVTMTQAQLPSGTLFPDLVFSLRKLQSRCPACALCPTPHRAEERGEAFADLQIAVRPHPSVAGTKARRLSSLRSHIPQKNNSQLQQSQTSSWSALTPISPNNSGEKVHLEKAFYSYKAPSSDV